MRSLKEMVVFPLLYPEVFEKFKVNPSRGVLFHGPPGLRCILNLDTLYIVKWLYLADI